MTVYRKCRPCKRRDGCEIKASLALAIKGYNVGTISHNCKSFEPEFLPGENLWVRVNDCPFDDGEEGYPELAVFPAHFVQYSKTFGRAIVYIEPGAESRDGETSFKPVAGRVGFCKVSYVPYHAKYKCALQKGIISRRDGETHIRDCCGLPTHKCCDVCAIDESHFDWI